MQTRIIQLIIKKLKGKSSQKELDELDEFTARSSENKEVVENLTDQKSLIQMIKLSKEINVDDAFQRIRRRAELAKKKVTNCLTKEELIELNSIIESSPNNKALMEELMNQQKNAEDIVRMSKSDVESCREIVKGRFPFAPKKTGGLGFMFVSAVVLLFLGCLVFYSIRNDKGKREYINEHQYDRIVNICVYNASTSHVLNLICEQTGMQATYDPEFINNSRSFSINANNAPLTYILDSISKVQDFIYHIKGNIIVLDMPSRSYLENLVKITIDADSAELTTILNQIHMQSGLEVKVLPGAYEDAKKMSIHVKDMPLVLVLQEICNKQSFVYNISESKTIFFDKIGSATYRN